MTEVVAPSFSEFMETELFPALLKAFQIRGVEDISLSYSDLKLKGSWRNNQRQFIIFFAKEDLNAQKAFACSDGKSKPETIEPFLGDERKISLELFIFGLMQRLNAQKWLLPN